MSCLSCMKVSFMLFWISTCAWILQLTLPMLLHTSTFMQVIASVACMPLLWIPLYSRFSEEDNFSTPLEGFHFSQNNMMGPLEFLFWFSKKKHNGTKVYLLGGTNLKGQWNIKVSTSTKDLMPLTLGKHNVFVCSYAHKKTFVDCNTTFVLPCLYYNVYVVEQDVSCVLPL